MVINMYFAVSWLEPRLVINQTAVEWDEDRTGPKNVSGAPHCAKQRKRQIILPFLVLPPSGVISHVPQEVNESPELLKVFSTTNFAATV